MNSTNDAALDLLDGCAKAEVLDVRHRTATGADDVVVMALRLAGHIGVVASRQVDALEHVELREEIESPEDRCPPDAQVEGAGIPELRAAIARLIKERL